MIRPAAIRVMALLCLASVAAVLCMEASSGPVLYVALLKANRTPP